jgi:hypothetical protein
MHDIFLLIVCAAVNICDVARVPIFEITRGGVTFTIALVA